MLVSAVTRSLPRLIGLPRSVEARAAAVLWTTVAVAKATDTHPFRMYLHDRLSLPLDLASLAAWGLVCAEFAVGAGLLIPRARRWAIACSILGSGVALVVALLDHPSVSCGCLGGLGEAARWQRVALASGILGLSLGSLLPARSEV